MSPMMLSISTQGIKFKGDVVTSRALFTMMRLHLFGADTTTIRWMLANASVFMSLSLFLDTNVFERPVYVIMKEFGTSNMWATYFLLHAFMSYWRLFDVRSRLNWAFCTNLLGLSVWFIYTISVNVAIGRPTPTLALEYSMLVAASWAFYRTGMKREYVSP